MKNTNAKQGGTPSYFLKNTNVKWGNKLLLWRFVCSHIEDEELFKQVNAKTSTTIWKKLKMLCNGMRWHLHQSKKMWRKCWTMSWNNILMSQNHKTNYLDPWGFCPLKQVNKRFWVLPQFYHDQWFIGW